MLNARNVLLALMIIIALPFLVGYMNYQGSKVNNEYSDEFISNINEVLQKNETFMMTDVATFDWDRMFMFPPYTTRDEMEQAVGIKWTTSASFLGYLIHRSDLGNHPLNDDSLHKLVFVDGDKVVLDITLNRSVDFTLIKRITGREESKFLVERTADKRIMIKNANDENDSPNMGDANG